MIQRIQTVYLALVLILSLLLLTMISVGHIRTEGQGQTESYVYKAYTVQKEVTGERLPLNANTFLIIELVVVILTAGISIFVYRNRILQIKLGKFNLFVNFILIAILFFYTESELKNVLPGQNLAISYSFGAYIPLLNVILLVLANRSIKKDEDLVRSADRLR